MSRMSDRAIQMEVGLIMQRCARLASPRLASPRLASPRLASPRLASPRLASPTCIYESV
jgi:hypothetical protein